MPRKLRVQYPGAIYHVMNRGDRRDPIFGDDQDRRRFLETLGQTREKTGSQVHASGDNPVESRYCELQQPILPLADDNNDAQAAGNVAAWRG